MLWKSKANWEVAQQRANVIRSIREFFYVRNLIEVETPLMSRGTVTDVHLESFTCQYGNFDDDSFSPDIHLQTSPEFAMKRLLGSGYGSIFQI